MSYDVIFDIKFKNSFLNFYQGELRIELSKDLIISDSLLWDCMIAYFLHIQLHHHEASTGFHNLGFKI